MRNFDPYGDEGYGNLDAYAPIQRDDRPKYQAPVYQRRGDQQNGGLNLSDILLAQDMMPQVKVPQQSGGSGGGLNLTSLLGMFGG